MKTPADNPPTAEKIPPYIGDHGWSILADHSQLRVDLDARNFRPRSGAVVVGAMGQQDERQRPDPWQAIDDRDDVTFDRLQVMGLDKRARKVSLRRLIVTTKWAWESWCSDVAAALSLGSTDHENASRRISTISFAIPT